MKEIQQQHRGLGEKHVVAAARDEVGRQHRRPRT